MGRKHFQSKWFYGFSLEERVPEDHFLRTLSRVVDFTFVRGLVAHAYSHTGSPSVDPVVVFKMALLGYLNGIASERRLAEEIRLNLAYLWFLGYDIDELPPDHSILSKARARYGPEVYRQFFFEVVRRCREAGLVEGGRLYVDASFVRANASLDSLVSRPLYTQLPEIVEHVDRVWAENETPEGGPSEDQGDPERSGPKLTQSIPRATVKADQLSANERRVSRTDPEATIFTDGKRGLFLAHKVHIAVDGGPERIITGLTVTPGSWSEASQVESLLGQHFWLAGVKPEELVADRGYSANRVHALLRRKRILPSIPRRRPWKDRRAAQERLGFVYVPEVDRYRCPKGHWLYRLEIPRNGLVRYRTVRGVCGNCELKPECTRAERCCITRPADADVRQWVDRHLATHRARVSAARRQVWVETVFADLKGNHALARATLRGGSFEIQALLSAAAHNVKQLLKRKPPKREAAVHQVGVARGVVAVVPVPAIR